MLFNFDFYSSLLLIFFVHTVVYAILFFVKFKKQQLQSSFWLGLFLLLAALYITPWMVGFAGWYGTQPYRDILFYTPFQHLFLIGPCIFFYVNSLFNPSFRVTKKEILHFIPSALYLAFCVVMVVYDKLVLRDYFFLKNGQDPDFDDWYQLLGFLSMISYFIASIKYYNAYKRAIENVISNSADFLFTWVRNFLFAFLFILIAWFLLALFTLVFSLRYIDSWWYFLAFAICCYYIAIAGYSNAVEAKIFFKTKIFSKENTALLQQNVSPLLLENNSIEFEEIEIESLKPEDKLNSNEWAAWKQKIEHVLLIEKKYEEPELTLFDIAKKLNTNISLLSKAINNAFNSNFNDVVNGYRIAAFIDLINQGEHKKQTILSLAFEVGFNSKATFNRAFKKIKGVSPQEFIKKSNFEIN
ncbi:MAG: helix-turn-helix domain-containing protein [Chitinophagaceae bacterium]